MAASDEETLSPKNRLKFLCSNGGKILPRPSDGQLKYVGGETRVVAVPRSITFSELKEKINGLSDAVVVIKYQVMPEDLDALVSVRSDEDLQHMLEEYDRHEQQPRSPTSAGSSRFRLFLFSCPSSAAPLEQRYVVDAVNGIPATTNRLIFTLSYSAGTSPTGTVDSAAMMNHDAALVGCQLARPQEDDSGMHKVRSTPNLSGSQQSQLASNGAVGSPHFHHRHPQQKYSTPYPGGGPWRVGGAQMMNGVRYEGCGKPIIGHQPQPMRRYYHPPASAGPTARSGGCVCCGHGDDAGAPRSGLGLHLAGAPPRKPAFE